jgi:hypothetical protein
MIVRGSRATEKMTWLDAYDQRGADDFEDTASDRASSCRSYVAF